MLRTIVLAIAIAPALRAQEFEVASVKQVPSRTGDIRPIDHGAGGPGSGDPTVFRCGNCLLVSLIETAFGLQRYQFDPPPWMSQSEFQMMAEIPEETTPTMFAVMMQNFLKSRFNLQYHFEKKEVSGYALVIAKGGSKLKEATAPAVPSPDPPGGQTPVLGKDGYPVLNHPGEVALEGRARTRIDRQTTGDLARMLGSQYAVPVEDATGLKGVYDINLFWVLRSAASPDRDSGPSFRDAIESQLGLKLEPRKITTDIFVIDHIERTPTAN